MRVAAVMAQTRSGGGLSGVNGVHTILAWLMWFALAVGAASFIVSAAGLAWAYYASRPGLAATSKAGIGWSVFGAFFVAVGLVNALYRV